MDDQEKVLRLSRCLIDIIKDEVQKKWDLELPMLRQSLLATLQQQQNAGEQPEVQQQNAGEVDGHQAAAEEQEHTLQQQQNAGEQPEVDGHQAAAEEEQEQIPNIPVNRVPDEHQAAAEEEQEQIPNIHVNRVPDEHLNAGGAILHIDRNAVILPVPELPPPPRYQLMLQENVGLEFWTGQNITNVRGTPLIIDIFDTETQRVLTDHEDFDVDVNLRLIQSPEVDENLKNVMPVLVGGGNKTLHQGHVELHGLCTTVLKRLRKTWFSLVFGPTVPRTDIMPGESNAFQLFRYPGQKVQFLSDSLPRGPPPGPGGSKGPQPSDTFQGRPKKAARKTHTVSEKARLVTGDSPQMTKAVVIFKTKDHAIEPIFIEGKTFSNYAVKQILELTDKILVMGNKLLIVQALPERGYVVAVTGDGTNDDAVLHETDVGRAQGTEVAKDISTLADNFDSVVKVFNEFNPRKPDELNVWKGVTKNCLFMGIVKLGSGDTGSDNLFPGEVHENCPAELETVAGLTHDDSYQLAPCGGKTHTKTFCWM